MVPKWPIFKAFWGFHEPKPVDTGSKWAKTTCLSIINGPGSFLENCVFDPFLTGCWSQNGPFSRHFGIFHGPKRATTGSKRPKNTCLGIPSGLGTTLEKMIFFDLGTLVDPPLAPTCQIQVLSQKLTGGGLGRWRQVGRCPPKSAQFWAKNSLFSPKTALVRVQKSQTKANGCYTPRAA